MQSPVAATIVVLQSWCTTASFQVSGRLIREPLAGVDLEKLVSTPPEQVELPSLAERRKKLKGWCNMGLVDFLSSVLEDLLPPVSQGSTAAAISLLRQDAEGEPERRSAPHGAHLAQRLASLNLRHSSSMRMQQGPSQTSAGCKSPTLGEEETGGLEQ